MHFFKDVHLQTNYRSISPRMTGGEMLPQVVDIAQLMGLTAEQGAAVAAAATAYVNQATMVAPDAPLVTIIQR
mgnify:CR=1 FL=1